MLEQVRSAEAGTVNREWFENYQWAYDIGHPDYGLIDIALFTWRARWFQPENNPFGRGKSA